MLSQSHISIFYRLSLNCDNRSRGENNSKPFMDPVQLLFNEIHVQNPRCNAVVTSKNDCMRKSLTVNSTNSHNLFSDTISFQ